MRVPRAVLGLALGGGGMKGWAHVGVISVLERYNLRPDMIAGSSVGALIGAFYAAGYTTEKMMDVMRAQKTSGLFSLRFDRLGLLSTETFRQYLVQHLGDLRIEDLSIPFYVICTDLETGREVVLSQGAVVDAILASSAIPGIFAPIEIEGRLLVDGGISNNVPVSTLINHGARYTIGIQLHRQLGTLDAPSLRKASSGRASSANGRRISVSLWAERLAKRFGKDSAQLPNGFEVLQRTLEIVVAQLEGYRLQMYPPDVLISPEVSHIGLLSFSEEKEEIYRCGVDAAEAQAKRLEELKRRCKTPT